MISWIKVIDENQAHGELKSVYESIGSERGKVANVMKVHSLNPAAMGNHLDLYKTLMFGRSGLSREDREFLAVVVSAANKCDYCIMHHAQALKRYWKDDGKVRQAIEDYTKLSLEPRQAAMAEYGVKLTLSPDAANEDDIWKLRDAGFPEEDILQINLIACYFNFVNRVTLGLGVKYTPEEMDGYNY